MPTKLTRRCLLGVASGALAAGPDRLRLVHTKGEKVAAYYGKRALLEYRYDRSRPKSYVQPLYLPDGSPLSVDAPADHVHHRGLMVAWSDVNGIDFWGEVNPARHGQIVHQQFEKIDEKGPLEIVAIQHWVAEGKLLLIEKRTLRIPPPPPEGVWLEWTSEFRPHEETVSLGPGTHVYNGLGMRFLPSMGGGRALNAEGAAAIGIAKEAKGEPSKWCAYYGPLESGKMAGAAILDHPGNPRHPSPYFVMNKPYGYLSAAPTYNKEPFILKPGDRLRFRWGVLAFLGEPRAEVLNRLHRKFSG
jgi:hypothetical protein